MLVFSILNNTHLYPILTPSLYILRLFILLLITLPLLICHPLLRLLLQLLIILPLQGNLRHKHHSQKERKSRQRPSNDENNPKALLVRGDKHGAHMCGFIVGELGEVVAGA